LERKNHGTFELPPGDAAVMALIRKIEGGDSSALMTLYDATSRLVFGLIMKILGDRTSAEQALLDVYTAVWKQPAGCDPRLPPLEWLLSLARDSAGAGLHGRKRDKARRGYAASGAGPEMTVAPEQQQRARSSLESMPPAQRELLEWAFYRGMSCSEMAAEIGKPVGAVRSHLRLGLGRFSDYLSLASAGEVKTETATGEDIEARKSD